MAKSEIDVSTGKVGFIERHVLWSDEQKEAAQRIESEVREKGLRQVRISWADQHGIARGKTLTVDGFSAALRNGKDFQSAVLIMARDPRVSLVVDEPDPPIRKVICEGTAVVVEAAVGPYLDNGEKSIWNKIGERYTGPRYLGERAQEYRQGGGILAHLDQVVVEELFAAEAAAV
jgi:hypothetical protein